MLEHTIWEFQKLVWSIDTKYNEVHTESGQFGFAGGGTGGGSGSTPPAKLQIDDAARQKLTEWFGKELSDSEITNLSGASSGTVVNASLTNSISGEPFDVLAENGPEPYVCLMVHGDGIKAERNIQKPYQNFPVTIENASLRVSKAQQGHGIGTQMLVTEADQASALGVFNITTTAQEGTGYNGYYTWARLGYDAPLSSVMNSFPLSDLVSTPDWVSGSKTMTDLMSLAATADHPSGASWWKANGTTWGGKFNLKPGSQSLQILHAYADARGIAHKAKRQDGMLSEKLDKGRGEEIPWSDEDEAIAERVWQTLVRQWSMDTKYNDIHAENGEFGFAGGSSGGGGSAGNAPLPKKVTGKSYTYAELRQTSLGKQLDETPNIALQLPGKTDTFLGKLNTLQGYDGPATIVPSLNATIAAGGEELVRGVSSKKYADDFISGPFHAGTGVYGNGTYAAFGDGALSAAKDYTKQGKGKIIRMALSPDAKIVDRADLSSQADAFGKAARADVQARFDALHAKDPAAVTPEIRMTFTNEKYMTYSLHDDLGRFATLQGYDAIRIPAEKYMIILNRTALIIQKKTLSGKGRGMEQNIWEFQKMIWSLDTKYNDIHTENGQFGFAGGNGGGGGGSAAAATKKPVPAQGKPYSYEQFLETPLGREYLANPDIALKTTGKTDHFMAKLNTMQGFDGPAQKVDSVDTISGDAMYRGVTSEKYATDFIDGPFHAGTGVSGNGTYVAKGAYEPTSLDTAQGYANAKGVKGAVLRMKYVKPGVYVADENGIRIVAKSHLKQAQALIASQRAEYQAAYPVPTPRVEAVLANLTKQEYAVQAIYGDPGRAAVLAGVDAMDLRNGGYTVLFNRTAVAVEKKPL